jgi:hypothetical protein
MIISLVGKGSKALVEDFGANGNHGVRTTPLSAQTL